MPTGLKCEIKKNVLYFKKKSIKNKSFETDTKWQIEGISQNKKCSFNFINMF